MKKISRKTVGIAFSGLALVGVVAPLACKQDGSSGGCGGGGGFGGLSNVLKPIAGAVGGAAGVDSKYVDTGMAGLKALEGVMISPAVEDGMGQSVAVSLTNTYQLTKDEKLNKYVSLVGLTVVNASNRPVGNWQFGVLESPEVNAFAGPNGYIFVTRGALNRMDNEAQLAGVLAHEVTHVLHHHGLEGVRDDAKGQLAKDLFDIHVNDPTGTGLVKSMAGPAIKKVVTSPYNQGQEHDADQTAIKLLVAAGYDPTGLPQFLEKLQSAGGGPFSTHPGQPDRIKRTRAQIAQLGGPNKGKLLQERFKKNVVVK